MKTLCLLGLGALLLCGGCATSVDTAALKTELQLKLSEYTASLLETKVANSEKLTDNEKTALIALVQAVQADIVDKLNTMESDIDDAVENKE